MTRKIALAMEIAAAVAAVAAATAIMSVNAYADDITIDNSPFVSTKSRAEVLAELMNKGGLTEWALQLNDSPFKSSYTKGQARAEYLAARDEIHALNSEDSGSVFYGKKLTGVDSRAIMGAPAR